MLAVPYPTGAETGLAASAPSTVDVLDLAGDVGCGFQTQYWSEDVVDPPELPLGCSAKRGGGSVVGVSMTLVTPHSPGFRSARCPLPVASSRRAGRLG